MIDPKLSKYLYIADSKDAGREFEGYDMRVVVPYYSEDSPEFIACKLNLISQGIDARYVNVSGDVYNYDKLFRELWNAGKTFIIVESDIIPWPGALQQLWECECIWGAYSYFVFGQLRVQFGCTKFNPKELGELPLSETAIHWSRLDWEVISTLSKRWHAGHLHNPAVSHLNYAHRVIGKVKCWHPETIQPIFG